MIIHDHRNPFTVLISRTTYILFVLLLIGLQETNGFFGSFSASFPSQVEFLPSFGHSDFSNLRTSSSNSYDSLSIENELISLHQVAEASTIVSSTQDNEFLLSLINGTGDGQIKFIFFPQENFTIDDYELTLSNENNNILSNEDISVEFTETKTEGFLAYNVTVEMDFNKWTGMTNVSLIALNATTGVVEVSSEPVKVTVVGITFYKTDLNGNLEIFGGPERPLNITTEEILQSTDYNLNVFVQNYDGSSSNDSLPIPLSSVIISTTGLEGQINYNSSCSPVIGSYNGADVVLPSQCGIGFSETTVNGSYENPFLGIDFQKYYNGSFTTGFEWSELVIGSDLEEDGYETFLTVVIDGEVPPVVMKIYPEGPFTSSGIEEVIVNVRNLPKTVQALREWEYDLQIAFEDGNRSATLNQNSFTVFENGTSSLVFTVPRGVGINLPWNLAVKRNDGVTLVAIDETNPPYLFSFTTQVFIASITPNTGPDTGGTAVTLIGEFPTAQNGNFSVTFNGVEINSSLITSFDESSISFLTPPRETVGEELNADVRVTINGVTSNSVIYIYEPSLLINDIDPSFGAETGGIEITLSGQFNKFDPSGANSAIFFDSTRLDDSSILSHTNSFIKFRLPARSELESQQKYTFNVTVQADGSESNPVLFSYIIPLVIESIIPSSGDTNGGTVVSLGGQFANFSLENSKVFIGNSEIDRENILSHNDSIIQLITPPLSQIGTSRRQLVWLTTGTVESNRVVFTYTDQTPAVRIQGEGGELDSGSGRYLTGRCNNAIFRAASSFIAISPNTTYEWTLTNTNGESVLSDDIEKFSDIILIPYQSIPETNSPYNLTIKISSGSTVFNDSLVIIKQSVRRIGVLIPRIRPRSPSDPNVTLTVPAFITDPDCEDDKELSSNTTEMTFIWKYRDQTYLYSYLNESSPSNEVGPTLLGREFQIPQQFMEYGTFPISLTVFLTEEPAIRGSGSANVFIEAAPLFSQINGGQTSQIIAVSQPFVVSGLKSHDPDLLSGNQTEGLQYAWKCKLSDDPSLSSRTACPENLLPTNEEIQGKFTISQNALRSVHNLTRNVYIQYSLQVLKSSTNATGFIFQRSSDISYSTLILAPSEEDLYESLENVLVVNNQSIQIDMQNVKYYENVIISPVSGSSETTWRIELLSPQSESRKLLATDENLLPYPGYYRVGIADGRYVLGLKANVLLPSTQYQFLISTFRSGFAINEQEISLSTVDEPVVSIGRQISKTGTTNDTFLLTATANYDGDFKFFFFLTDEFGFEHCAGGCQGTSFIKFRILTQGTYQVRCDLYDSLGYTLLASADGEEIIVTTFVPTDGDLSLFGEDFNDAFLAGDHATYQQIGLDMVKYIQGNNGSTFSDFDSDILSNFSLGLSQISGNAVPNSIQSLSYVRTAAAMASLTPDLGITYSTEALYALLNITINAIGRTPDSAALQQLEDLLDFYDLAPELLLSSFSTGTTRRRLLQEIEDDQEVNPIFLDLYEVMKEQIQLSVLKRCTCGCVEEVKTGVRSSSRDALRMRSINVREESDMTAAALYKNPTQSSLNEVNIKMAHYCNPEQGTNLIVKDGLSDEAEFKWCKEIFGGSVLKLYFAIATTPNYLTLANLYANVTLTEGLFSTSVSIINDNTIQDMEFDMKDCYRLRVPVLNELVQFSEEAHEDQIPAGLKFSPAKKWGSEVIEGLYTPIFGNITTITSKTPRRDDSTFSDVSLISSSPGLMTVATRFAWTGAIFSLDGVLLTVFEIVGVTVSILVLILVATLVSWIIATRVFAGMGATAPVELDFTYVERDVYGRGTAIDIGEEHDATG